MKRQKMESAKTLSTITTILLIGKNQGNLFALAQWVGASDRIVIMASSRKEVQKVLEYEQVDLAIIDSGSEGVESGILSSIKKRRGIQLVILKNEASLRESSYPESVASLPPAITRLINTPLLDDGLPPLLS